MKLDLMENKSLTDEGHTCDKQFLKTAKRFDDANRRFLFLIFFILQKSYFH